MNTIFDVIIRPEIRIKSRQWWIHKLQKIKKKLRKFLPRKNHHLNQSSLTLLLTNNKEIQKLNKKYRKINKPTDVLSFHLIKKEQLNKKYLGDIVISIETARKQAHQKKKSLEEEIIMLIVHGYLHLLGYDHLSKKEAKVMFSLQNKVLKDIGIKSN